MFKIVKKYYFLLDAFGALYSALFLGVTIVTYNSFFGIPESLILTLSFVALMLFVYDAICFLFINEKWKSMLKFLGYLNITYSIVSLSVVFYYFSELTILGLIYFSMEIVVITLLALKEIQVSKA